MHSHRDHDKARRYLDLLDTARSEGRWQDLPELIRKVEKHAPQRKCLTLAARLEMQIASQKADRPKTANNTQVSTLGEEISRAQRVEEKDNTATEDVFQAKTCLSWLHSTLGESAQVLSQISAHEIAQAIERFTNNASSTKRSTHICIVRSTCLRGMALENTGKWKDAVPTYEPLLEYLSRTQSTTGATAESSKWTESLLARYCALVNRHMRSHLKNPQALLTSTFIPPSSILQPYRLWSSYRQDKQNSNFFGMVSVWKAYYDVLSILLQHHILTPIFASRLDQKAELIKVQSAYETILMRVTDFPHANQVNTEIESWVDQIMANWRTIQYPPWNEDDLGSGGKTAYSRSVLDVLYRAATRTFHSTRVLRHLFTVHSVLAEFRLAEKALETYIDVISRGKARVQKSGEKEVSLDDDATAMTIVSAGIRMLCSHGRREEVERSLKIAKKLEIWLHGPSRDMPAVAEASPPGDGLDPSEKLQVRSGTLSHKATALAYHAIGISQSCWARLTFETSTRSELQSKAIANFKKALQQELDDGANVEILYSLAYALAEVREVDAAIKVARSAVSVGSEDDPESEASVDPHQRDMLLKSWHLLALLLSARQNYAAATTSCEEAFEAYGGEIFRHGDPLNIKKIPGLQLSERCGLIELKMTQLALSEVIDGPEEAVNASGELLGLYARLFKTPDEAEVKPSGVKTASSAASIAGTQRSFRGSLLSHPKDRKSRLQMDGAASSSAGSLEPLNEITGGPAIAITSEDKILPSSIHHHHQNFLGRHESNKLRKRNSRKSIGSQRRNRTPSPSKPSTSDGTGHLLPMTRDGQDYTSPFEETGTASTTYPNEEVGLALTHDNPSHPATPAAVPDPPNPLQHIPSATHNMGTKNPNPNPAVPKPPSTTPYPQSIAISPQNTTFASSLPEPGLSPQLSTRHAQTLLIKIWLQISSLYRRAGLSVEATAAIKEATTTVRSIESTIASSSLSDEGGGSSDANIGTPPLGGFGLRALGDLWADILAESGFLYLSKGDVMKAEATFEAALGWWPDHSAAITGLTNLLLDSYEKACQKPRLPTLSASAIPITSHESSTNDAHTPILASSLPIHPPKTTATDAGTALATDTVRSPSLSPSNTNATTTTSSTTADLENGNAEADPTTPPDGSLQRKPSLTTLSARDRAYSLLSMLTKSGAGWDDSEAWYALARAYECSGMAEKALESLWWVVELEGGKAVRPWNAVGL